MPEPVVDRPRSRGELADAIPHIQAAPADAGRLECIVVRPHTGARLTPDTVRITARDGLEGDHWVHGCWQSLPDGSPDPDVQVCLMPARVLEAIAGADGDWAAAGDSLVVDMDMTPANLPPGSQVRLGDVELEITAVPHHACADFIERYGREAGIFVNTGRGRALCLRGIYARVTRDGTVRIGDRLTKIAAGDA